MTIETLQSAMITAMKNGDKYRKTVISSLIAQIKKAAIDKSCRDNISEEMINTELIKAKKQAQESIDACPESRADLLDEYKKQMEIICEFAPALITDANKIAEIIHDSGVEMNKGKIMKYLNTNFKGKIDMGVASRLVGEMLK